MWHVLEHLPNIKETICNLHKILSPEGKLIIAVPNNKSFDAHTIKSTGLDGMCPFIYGTFLKKQLSNCSKKINLN